MSPAAPAIASPLESLPSDQITLLLRTLRLHVELLESVHQDAQRLSQGSTPGYIVDYQLLHRIIYEQHDNPESLVEFAYLVEQESVPLIIGHGTAMEILYRVQRSIGVPASFLTGVSSYEDFRSSFPILSKHLDESLTRLLTEAPQHGRAMQRLAEVLNHENIQSIWDIEKRLGTHILDEDAYGDAYGAAFGVLESVRRDRYYSNVADAMNFADVVGLRRASEGQPMPLFPFLLTDTRPLLDERRWARDPQAARLGFEGAVSRAPLTAIYSHLFLSDDRFAPGEIAGRTVELTFEAARLEHELRRSEGYRGGVSVAADSWERIAAEKRVTKSLAKQLRLLSDFVSDPAISEAQRIYDNSQLAVANWAMQYGHAKPANSPRRLFDLILSLSRVLSERGSLVTNMGALWESVISRRVERADSWTTLTYRRRGGADGARPYLEVERHRNFTTFRWPCTLEVDTLLSSFSTSFLRHQINEVSMFVGAPSEVIRFRAQLPVTADELRDGMRGAEKAIGGLAEGELAQVLWVRMDSDAFDLYADIVPAHPGEDALIGVTAHELNLHHLKELYSVSSSRFVFESWLDALLYDAMRSEWEPGSEAAPSLGV